MAGTIVCPAYRPYSLLFNINMSESTAPPCYHCRSLTDHGIMQSDPSVQVVWGSQVQQAVRARTGSDSSGSKHRAWKLSPGPVVGTGFRTYVGTL
jgi:hypothetical protein